MPLFCLVSTWATVPHLLLHGTWDIVLRPESTRLFYTEMVQCLLVISPVAGDCFSADCNQAKHSLGQCKQRPALLSLEQLPVSSSDSKGDPVPPTAQVTVTLSDRLAQMHKISSTSRCSRISSTHFVILKRLLKIRRESLTSGLGSLSLLTLGQNCSLNTACH